MSRQKFIDLIVRYCAIRESDHASRIILGCPVLLGDMRFSLIQSDEIDADLLFIYGNLGCIPEGLSADLYRALLTMNLFTYAGLGLTLTVSAETGTVLCAIRYNLCDITPEHLDAALTTLAVNAVAWRKDYFLAACTADD